VDVKSSISNGFLLVWRYWLCCDDGVMSSPASKMDFYCFGDNSSAVMME
jgi:hypothetical protein